MSGRELKKLVFMVGLSPTAFCSEAGVSMPTYYKFVNGQKINDQSTWKIESAIQRLKAQVSPPARRKEPAVS